MKFGLIGCGRISPNHIAAAQANGLDIVGLCDIDKAIAIDKKVKFDLDDDTPVYTDYLERGKTGYCLHMHRIR